MPFATPPTRFDAVETNATLFPSRLIDGALDAPFPGAPAALAETSATVWAASSAT